jgi:hypothetical protein
LSFSFFFPPYFPFFYFLPSLILAFFSCFIPHCTSILLSLLCYYYYQRLCIVQCLLFKQKLSLC